MPTPPVVANLVSRRDRATVVEQTYVIRQITQRMVDQAYPLVLLARPHLTLEAWRHFCAGRTEEGRTSARPRCGVLLAVTSTGYVRGLCSYEIKALTATRHVLCVDILVFAHLFQPREILYQLLDELEAIADSHGCDSIDIEAEDLGEWLDRAGPGRKLPVRSMRDAR